MGYSTLPMKLADRAKVQQLKLRVNWSMVFSECATDRLHPYDIESPQK